MAIKEYNGVEHGLVGIYAIKAERQYYKKLAEDLDARLTAAREIIDRHITSKPTTTESDDYDSRFVEWLNKMFRNPPSYIETEVFYSAWQNGFATAVGEEIEREQKEKLDS